MYNSGNSVCGDYGTTPEDVEMIECPECGGDGMQIEDCKDRHSFEDPEPTLIPCIRCKATGKIIKP